MMINALVVIDLVSTAQKVFEANPNQSTWHVFTLSEIFTRLLRLQNGVK